MRSMIFCSSLTFPGHLQSSRVSMSSDEKVLDCLYFWLYNLRKCHASLHGAKAALAGNEIGKAKESYIKARDIYIGLEYAEKKELYNELMEIYNKLSNVKNHSL